MTHTYCMTSHCPLAEDCARFEGDAGRNCLTRTYADFSEELIRRNGDLVECPFFMAKNTTDGTALLQGQRPL